jgi:predicted nuclease of predicted toxin-antitoxin system
MRFIIDAQLPPASARTLGDRGHHAEHVAEVGLRDADDAAVREFAEAPGAVVVTKDEDFAERKRLRPGGPPVRWLRVGSGSNAALRDWLAPLRDDIEARLEAGEGLIEVI